MRVGELRHKTLFASFIANFAAATNATITIAFYSCSSFFCVGQIVRDAGDLMRLIDQGNAVRKVAATNMNEQSSRSHSCFTIKIEKKTTSELAGGVTRETIVKAKLNLVDLAGSERADKTGATGATLKEGTNINLSLMALGNVINALSEGTSRDGKKHIPYRDSKLTRLLQESLGGNSLTVMLAAISPADYNYDETVGTLKYANRAKSIANAATRNEDSNERIIRGLKEEIDQLRKQLSSGGGAEANPELEKRLKEMEQGQQSAWEEKELLSKALEEERQANINTAISTVISQVKVQKVGHMKAIKRLTNEKTSLTKQFNDTKDENVAVKKLLDDNLKSYQFHQASFEQLHGQAERGVEDDAKLEDISNAMNEILSKIEKDRDKWVGTKETAKKIKARLAKIEDDLTDEKAELVATAVLLDQNDRVREQIQLEEREKAKEMIAAELSAAKQELDIERAAVRGTIEEEMAEEKKLLANQLVDLQRRLLREEKRSAEMTIQIAQQKKDIDGLENSLADAEVNQEYADQEVVRLTKDCERIEEMELKVEQSEERVQQSRRESEREVAKERERGREREERLKTDFAAVVKGLEAERYSMFSMMMDAGERERQGILQRLTDTKTLLHRAVQVPYLFVRHLVFLCCFDTFSLNLTCS